MMDFIELDIREALEKIAAKAKAQNWNGDTPCTKAVLKGIVDVGRANGYLTAAHKDKCVSDNKGEWLYDIVWYQYDKAVYLTDVALVAKCEWGHYVVGSTDNGFNRRNRA